MITNVELQKMNVIGHPKMRLTFSEKDMDTDTLKAAVILFLK